MNKAGQTSSPSTPLTNTTRSTTDISNQKINRQAHRWIQAKCPLRTFRRTRRVALMAALGAGTVDAVGAWFDQLR